MYRCYDIMTLSETWLDETVTDLEVCPVGYDLFIDRRIQIEEEVVSLLFYPVTFIVVFALIHPKGILNLHRYSFIM